MAARAGAAFKLWHSSKPLRRRVLALREMRKAGEDVGFSELFDDLSELEKQAKKFKKERKKEKKRLKKQRKKHAEMEKRLQKQRRRRRQQRRRRKVRLQRRARGNAPHRQGSRRHYHGMEERIEDPYMRGYMAQGVRGSRSQVEDGPKSNFWKKFNELIDDLLGESSQHETHNRGRRL